MTQGSKQGFRKRNMRNEIPQTVAPGIERIGDQWIIDPQIIGTGTLMTTADQWMLFYPSRHAIPPPVLRGIGPPWNAQELRDIEAAIQWNRRAFGNDEPLVRYLDTRPVHPMLYQLGYDIDGRKYPIGGFFNATLNAVFISRFCWTIPGRLVLTLCAEAYHATDPTLVAELNDPTQERQRMLEAENREAQKVTQLLRFIDSQDDRPPWDIQRLLRIHQAAKAVY
jgi:hypothetical protein